jgi:MFS family permease
VSNIGSWLQAIASLVYVYQLTGSVVAVGILNAVGFLPILLFSVTGGSLADRYDRRAVVAVASLLSLAAAWLLAALTFAGLANEAVVIAVFFLLNSLFALSKPANVSLVPALVPREDIAEAVSWNSLSYILGQIGGPILATLILVTAGVGWAFVVNGVTFLALIASVAYLRTRGIGGHEPARREADGSTRPVESAIAYSRAHPWVPALLLAIIACTVPFEIIRTLSPALAAEALGESEEAAGIIVAAHSLGASLGLSIVVPALRRRGWARRMGFAAMVLQAVGLTAAAVAPSFVTACIAIGIVGVGFSLGFPVLTGILQEEVADRVRGRILALHQMAHLGNRPFAAIGVGLLAALIGPQPALLGGVVLIPLGIFVLRRAWQWLDADPERESAQAIPVSPPS